MIQDYEELMENLSEDAKILNGGGKPMIKVKMTVVRYAVLVAALICIAWMMDTVDDMVEDAVLQAFFLAIRNLIHISLIVSWCTSLYRRILNKQVRQYMITTALLMAFWLMAKAIKYEFIASRLYFLGRYIWYSYYIPMILIPLFGVFIIDHIGKPEDYRIPKKMYYLYIPAGLILVGIFTNDLHQLAFSFPEGIEWFDSIYKYGVIYFAAMAWFVLGGIYFVGMLLKKSRVPGSKAMQKLPLMIMLGAVAFWTLYCLEIFRDCDLTVVDCLIISLLLESAIQSGLIPSNTNYDEIFRTSRVAAQIVDEEYRPCIMSAVAVPLTVEQMKQAETDTVNLGNTLLHSKPITAGHVLWQDDVTQINKLMERLQDTREQLNQSNHLLQAELELKENQAKADEKNRLYDRISKEVASQLLKVEEILKRIDNEPEQAENLMAKVCVIGSYIKRRGNLLLLWEENQRIDARELEYCIRESLDNLRLAQVFTSFECECAGELLPTHIIAVYDLYETLVESLLDNVTAMMIRLRCRDGQIKIRLQVGCKENIAQNSLANITVPFGSFSYEIQEEDAIISYTVSEGGAEE